MFRPPRRSINDDNNNDDSDSDIQAGPPPAKRTKLTPAGSLEVSEDEIKQLHAVYPHIEHGVLKEQIAIANEFSFRTELEKIKNALSEKDYVQAGSLLFSFETRAKDDSGAMQAMNENNLGQLVHRVKKCKAAKIVNFNTVAWPVINFRKVVSAELVSDDQIYLVINNRYGHLALNEMVGLFAVNPETGKSQIDNFVSGSTFSKKTFMQSIIICISKYKNYQSLMKLKEIIKCEDIKGAAAELLINTNTNNNANANTNLDAADAADAGEASAVDDVDVVDVASASSVNSDASDASASSVNSVNSDASADSVAPFSADSDPVRQLKPPQLLSAALSDQFHQGTRFPSFAAWDAEWPLPQDEEEAKFAKLFGPIMCDGKHPPLPPASDDEGDREPGFGFGFSQ